MITLLDSSVQFPKEPIKEASKNSSSYNQKTIAEKAQSVFYLTENIKNPQGNTKIIDNKTEIEKEDISNSSS